MSLLGVPKYAVLDIYRELGRFDKLGVWASLVGCGLLCVGYGFLDVPACAILAIYRQLGRSKRVRSLGHSGMWLLVWDVCYYKPPNARFLLFLKNFTRFNG